MNLRTFPIAVILFLALVLALPQGASAEAVGHFTQVQGRVDLLKGGKLPATPVKVGDGVEEGDVLRAKSLSKAQITFVDQSTLTISPESRIAIEKYMFDGAKGKRSALVQVFQGMVLAVVSKIYQTEQPDFVVKTHTAIMGIRGTQVGIHITANSSQFLNFQGITRVSSNFAEVPGHVDLHAMEATEVLFGKTPMLKYELHPEDQKFFMMRMNVAAVKPQAQAAVCSAGSPSASACTPGTAVASRASSGEGLGSDSNALGNNPAGSGTPGGGITIVPQIPQLTQVAQAPTLQTFSFTSQYFSSYYSMVSLTYSGAATNGTITGASPATFQSNFTATFNIPVPGGSSGTSSQGSILWLETINARTTPVPTILTSTGNAPFSGPMNLNGWVYAAETPQSKPPTNLLPNFTLTGTATLQNNTLTYVINGTNTPAITETLPPPVSSPTSLTPTSLTQTSSTPTSLPPPSSTPQTLTAQVSTAKK